MCFRELRPRGKGLNVEIARKTSMTPNDVAEIASSASAMAGFMYSNGKGALMYGEFY
jgi:hypothetical protein